VILQPKRIFYVTALLLIAAQICSQDKISFIAVGDWGRRGENQQTEVAYQMSVWAKDNNADFVISLGDNMYENGVTSTDDSLWLESYENIYTFESLQIPWYAALGNHDYHGNVQAEIDYSAVSSRWKMPSRFFSFTQKLDDTTIALFVIIDSSPICISDEESKDYFSEDISKIDNNVQLKWLDSTLKYTPAKWKFVCGHHPIISGGYHGGLKEMQDYINPILVKNKVDFYFCGHDHDMQHLKKGKINYFVSGAGSATRNCESTKYTVFYSAKTSGFLGITLTAAKMKAVFTDSEGTTLYTTTFKK
jgi:acid phosphatase